MAKKKSLGKILLAFTIFFSIVVVSFFVGYFYFEFQRLNLYGVKPFSDFKSYTASLIKRVPFLGNTVNYTPLKVIPYQQLVESRLSSFQEVLDSQKASLDSKEKAVLQSESTLNAMKTTLLASETALKKRMDSFNKLLQEQQSYETRLQTLDQWITNSDPTKIGQILATSNIPVKTVVDAMVKLSPQTAGSLLQSIAQSNPTLASSIVNTLAGGTK